MIRNLFRSLSEYYTNYYIKNNKNIYNSLGRWRQTLILNQLEKNKIINFNQFCAQDHGI